MITTRAPDGANNIPLMDDVIKLTMLTAPKVFFSCYERNNAGLPEPQPTLHGNYKFYFCAKNLFLNAF